MGNNYHEKINILGRWDVCRHRFDNGLRILLLEDRSTPLISYHTWFSVGSRHDRQGKTGLAHLFEHMMFESTKTHPAGSFERELEKMGIETNAATWFDWTYYHETLPPEGFDLVLEYESDRMTNLIIDEQTLEREKNVVMNERKFRVEDRVEGMIEEILYKTAFVNHPYRNPTIGWMEDIRSFTLQDCLDFYKSYYNPANAIIVVTGNFEHDFMMEKIESKYAKIPSYPVPSERKFEEIPQKVEKRIVLFKEVPAPRVSIGYHVCSFGHPDNALLSTLAIVLCGGETGRLIKRLVHEEEVASDVSSWVGSFRFPALMEFHIDLRKDVDPLEAITIFDEEIEKLSKDGVTEIELKTARNRVLLGFYDGFSGTGGKASALGFYETVLGDCGAMTGKMEEIKRVTADGVLKVLNEYLVPSKRTIITVLREEK